MPNQTPNPKPAPTPAPIPDKSPKVHGLDLDAQTRCRHYHGPTDIIAIKMKCCGKYYACKDCHEAEAAHAIDASHPIEASHSIEASHPIEVWPRHEWHTKAILCGACQSELTITQYLESHSRCPSCNARFNPRCANHHHFYFEVLQSE
jgi:uncharacterized CHY-type Zn-finger protein